jgi:hypothetical protein
MEDFVDVSFLTQIEDSVLSVSSYRHAEIVATGSQISHLKAVSEGSLDALDFRDAGSNDQKIINVYCDVNAALDKDAKISIDQFEAEGA